MKQEQEFELNYRTYWYFTEVQWISMILIVTSFFDVK